MELISVIIPVYNVENYIKRCVNSILNQTYNTYEIILIDDGSTDKSGEICDSYANDYANIKVIHQKNQGQSAARNKAISLAKGKWLCFVDSDDMVHPQMLELLYNAAVNSKAKISMCSAIEDKSVPSFFGKKIENEKPCKVYNINENILHELYEKGMHRCWVVWGKLIQTNIVKRISFEEGRVYEDNAVVCQWLYEANVVVDVPEELYFYYVNINGTSKSVFNLKKLDYLWALEQIITFYETIKFENLKKKFLLEYFEMAAMFYNKAITELNRPEVAESISKRMQVFFYKYQMKNIIPKEKKLYYYTAMFPKVMRYFQIVVLVIEIIKKDGIKGLLKRIKHIHSK